MGSEKKSNFPPDKMTSVKKTRRETNLVSLLPPEVSEIILAHLTHPQDQCNSALAYPSWKSIMEPTAQHWMFSNVYPAIQSYLGKPDIFNCRLTCNAWKQSIDLFLANVSLSQAIDFSSRELLGHHEIRRGYIFLYQEGKNDHFTSCYNFNTECKLNRFLLLTKDIPRGENPFLGRKLEISGTSDSFCSQVLKLLDKFGHHVWNLEFVCDQKPVQFTRLVRSCLERLPNLRKLTITTRNIIMLLYWEPKELFKSDEYAQQRESLGNHPFPKLPHLKHLKLNRRIFALLYECVLGAYQEQLETVDIFCTNLFPHHDLNTLFGFIHNYNGKLPSLCFTNLTQLHISIRSDQQVEQLRQLKSPIKILRVSVHHRKTEIAGYLHLFQHFGATLEVVRLEFLTWFRNVKRIYKQPVSFSRNLVDFEKAASALPKIKLLSILRPPQSLDYLGWFGAAGLPCLELCCEDYLHMLSLGGLSSKDEIEVYGWGHKMYESNIWERVASLREINFVELYITDDDQYQVKDKFQYCRDVYNGGSIETGGGGDDGE